MQYVSKLNDSLNVVQSNRHFKQRGYTIHQPDVQHKSLSFCIFVRFFSLCSVYVYSRIFLELFIEIAFGNEIELTSKWPLVSSFTCSIFVYLFVRVIRSLAVHICLSVPNKLCSIPNTKYFSMNEFGVGWCVCFFSSMNDFLTQIKPLSTQNAIRSAQGNLRVEEWNIIAKYNKFIHSSTHTHARARHTAVSHGFMNEFWSRFLSYFFCQTQTMD